MMKLYVLFFSLVTILVLHADVPKKQLLSPEDTLKELASLKKHAIVIGNGPKEVHSFIDPYCELSQQYLQFIYARNAAMLKKYTIYLYLYELKGKNSSEMIDTILSTEYQETMLKSVMIAHDDVITESSGEAEEDIEAIAHAAQKIGVFKRPYIIINGKVK
jgi:hypothetical protein